jgi:UPF0148 protein
LVQSDEDVKLKKISKLLEIGGTMLAQHCECGSPLFRYQGNIICPVCNFKKDKTAEDKKQITKNERNSQPVATIQDNLQKINKKEEKTQPINNANKINFQPSDLQINPPTTQYFKSLHNTSDFMSKETHEFINNTIINKIVQLCLDLQRETDLNRVNSQIEAIESGINTLNLLNRYS